MQNVKSLRVSRKLSLAEIGDVLDGAGTDLRELLCRQLQQTEERIAAAQRLRRTLLAVIGALARDGEAAGPSVDAFVKLIRGDDRDGPEAHP